MVNYTSNEPINVDAKSERDRTDLISLKKEAQTLTGNFSDGTSIYLQIAEVLENDILRGVLEEVKRLVREARALGITREELAAMLAKAGGEKGGNAE